MMFLFADYQKSGHCHQSKDFGRSPGLSYEGLEEGVKERSLLP
jgi:hypothetical protein